MLERITKNQKDDQTISHQGGLMAMLFLFLTLPITATLFPSSFRIVFALTYSLMIFAGIKALSGGRFEYIVIIVLGVISFLFVWFTFFNVVTYDFTSLKNISLLAFFIFLGGRLFRKLLIQREVNLNVIFASISGYLILGIIGGLFFQALEITLPGSFNLTSLDNELYDLLYYSFVTLTTLGFGDVTPVSEAAKSMTIILSIVGQLYLTILIAILVGKYLSK